MVREHPLKAYRLRQEPRLSQAKFAKRLGVTRTTVARWETGTRKVDHELLPRVVEETGIAPSDLRPDLADLLKVRE
jgi:transcriptional regulator with XRE-family HTH domain